ncbi:MAG: hypothetical protein AAGA55_03135 [Planctomycetota bacterium]
MSDTTNKHHESREAAEHLFACLTRLYAKTADPRMVACHVREMHDSQYEPLGVERSDAVMERSTDALAECVARLMEQPVDRDAGSGPVREFSEETREYMERHRQPLAITGQGEYARTIEESGVQS